MRGSRFYFMAVISLGMMLFAASESSYAQSQYRRESSNRQQPAKQQSHKQQANRFQQPQKPSYEHKPQQGSRPSQYGSRPPQQGNRPPQYGNKPPQPKPGYAPPPPGHHKPSSKYYPGGFGPHPSLNFYGYYRSALPFGAKVIRGGAYDYYYVDGRYYRYINNVYVICRPPVGAVIARSLLNGIVTLTNYVVIDTYGKSQRCYTDNDGVYYIKSGRDYVVVDPPVGAIVYELPYGFEEVTINGAKYYKADKYFYELIYNGPRDYCFKVVGSMG